ncbi:hypothetical protein Ahia01_000647500 [Argonauta hians]
MQREDTMPYTGRILPNTATNVTRGSVTPNPSRQTKSPHLPANCDPFINKNGCLSYLQQDDVYIKIIDTDSKRRRGGGGGRRYYYEHEDEHRRENSQQGKWRRVEEKNLVNRQNMAKDVLEVQI